MIKDNFERQILHIDMNNFFASVECLYAPDLRNIPMAVGGSEENRHGIILAKNQLAKEKGVKTAEPLWEARRKCPEITIVKPQMDKYIQYSKAAINIYMQYTDQVESFGIDECWLDVTGSTRLFGTGHHIADEIRERIKTELGLTVSIGLSFNKIFAKLGSDYKKPDAVTEITVDNFKSIVWPLPARELLFVGASTQKTLEKYGIRTIGDIARTDKKILESLLGKTGGVLWIYSNGLDSSAVTVVGNEEEIKSIGNSTTTPKDLVSDQDVKKTLYTLAESVAKRLRKHGMWANGLQLTIRRSNLNSYQRSCTLESPVADSESIFKAAFLLYKKSHEKDPIRSLGIKVERLTTRESTQLSFFENIENNREALERVVDTVQERYGDKSVFRALLCENTEDVVDP